jgi:hypothetical protein
MLHAKQRSFCHPPPPPPTTTGDSWLPVPGLGLPVPRESLLARTISMGWYCILRGESRWGVRVDLPPSLYRGMAVVQSSVNSEPIPCTAHAPH